MIQLRPYQSQAISLIRQSMANGNRHLIYQSATGSGKSVVFSELCRLSANKGSQVLICTHRIEIFKSTFAHLERSGLVPFEIKAGSPNPSPNEKIIVSMVETLDRRLKKGFELYPDCVIIDECHFQNFTKLINHFASQEKKPYVIGVSASPIGKHLSKIYTDLISNIEIKELIEQGYLVRCEPYMMQRDISGIKIKGSGINAEFDEASMFEAYDKAELYIGAVGEWKKKCLLGSIHGGGALRTLVFNCNIEHAKKMTDAFIENGIESRCITSLTPMDEREQTLIDFQNGVFPVLNNVSVFTTGTDIPSIECVVVNRCTLSLALWLQMQGRASRPFESPSGNKKQKFIVLDMGRNHIMHGLWCEKREWKLEKEKKKKVGAPACKECKSCGAMLPARVMVCEFCGFQFNPKDMEEESPEGVMIEVKEQRKILLSELLGRKISSLSVDELIILEHSKRYKSQFIWRIVRSKGQDAIDYYAMKKNYSQGWAIRQYSEIGNSSFTDFVIKDKQEITA